MIVWCKTKCVCSFAESICFFLSDVFVFVHFKLMLLLLLWINCNLAGTVFPIQYILALLVFHICILRHKTDICHTSQHAYTLQHTANTRPNSLSLSLSLCLHAQIWSGIEPLTFWSLHDHHLKNLLSWLHVVGSNFYQPGEVSANELINFRCSS